MKKFFLGIVVLAVVLGGCGANRDTATNPHLSGSRLNVVTTTSILADLATQVAGERADVQYIIPIGQSPEDYELLPSDMLIISRADLFFTNGLGLEAMIEKALNRVTQTPVRHTSDGVIPIPLVGEETPDPHAWLDVQNAIIYVENILAALIEADPDGEAEYRRNAGIYLEELTRLDAWLLTKTLEIPENNRVLITSENALKYFGKAYGFETEGIWELNAHEEGTPQQIRRVIELIRKRQIPAVFLETTVVPRYMEMVARETGVPIAGILYTDALGTTGSGVQSYVQMMEHNMAVLLEGLTQ